MRSSSQVAKEHRHRTQWPVGPAQVNAAASSKRIVFAVPEINSYHLGTQPGVHRNVSHRKRVTSVTVWVASELSSSHKAEEAKAAGRPEHCIIKVHGSLDHMVNEVLRMNGVIGSLRRHRCFGFMQWTPFRTKHKRGKDWKDGSGRPELIW